MENFWTVKSCRSCGSGEIKEVPSLGMQFVSNFVEDESTPALKIPLELLLCDRKNGGCGLLQLRHTTSPELMYRHYWYESGMNETMRLALADITQRAEGLLKPATGDLVLDIGCNDGTLLRSYRSPGLTLGGFEPSLNISRLAEKGTSKIINDFFSYSSFQKAWPGRKAKIITAIAMFYDLDDPNSFVADVARCLSPDGLWVIQMSYLLSMLEKNAFDTICHEHLEYYSLSSLRPLLHRHALEVMDVEVNDVNGGSFRIYICHRGAQGLIPSEGAKERIRRMEEAEAHSGLNDVETYAHFSDRIFSLKRELLDFLRKKKAEGKRVYAYGASTKGNAMLQFLGIDAGLISKAIDKNPKKWGKKTVGTGISIISEEVGRAEKPDYLLILPWHFLEEFKNRESAYLTGGGKFIVPLPNFRIIGAEAV